ncbi:glyoxalase/bleomycin resistance protein/dioxygenase superfamily protein [Paenibacillus cellulosilyticus]|uniref:Glyoxalase/bleomycin resistance protein/dioxygenase superfamily protein n=1 Tax=Paenibacillus cellulosilyticus TaxID=375489 RepID=A0A2V2YMT5_9BACL|nr:VOC family protein [Paenibacillus cellulosilyticus]PWV95833.1 glyoxalase/bleomycin resistance protein/dioxygenase superfamily protein [Paenibacillus cellulosilyticus]QKS47710.1 VOC family protein [Paenibacillus cellulosilyticus]
MTAIITDSNQAFDVNAPSELQGVVVAYLPAYQLDESAAWYERYVGYQVTHRGDVYTLERERYLKLILVEIGSTSHPIQFNRGGDSNAVFMVGSADIDRYRSFLVQQGVEVTEIVDRGVCGRSFQMKDPAGNRIVVDG